MPLKPIRSREVVPVGEFKAQIARWLKHVGQTGQQVMITQNGKVAGILISPAEYDDMVEREAYLAAIDEGLADLDAGRYVDDEELGRILDEEFGPLDPADGA